MQVVDHMCATLTCIHDLTKLPARAKARTVLGIESAKAGTVTCSNNVELITTIVPDACFGKHHSPCDLPRCSFPLISLFMMLVHMVMDMSGVKELSQLSNLSLRVEPYQVHHIRVRFSCLMKAQ